MQTIKTIALAAATILLTPSVFAQMPEPADTTVSERVRFGMSRSVLADESKRGLLQFIGSVDSVLRNDGLVSVSVSGSSSPDGPEALNHRLSAERAVAVRDFMASGSGLSPDAFSVFAKGEDWERFAALVENDPDVPMRGKVMDIIASSDSPAGKEARLRTLDGGRAWRYLADNIFPDVRVAVVDVTYRNAAPMRQVVPMPAAGSAFLDADTLHVIPRETELEVSVYDNAGGIPDVPAWKRHAYVKTNLPAWLMLWANIAGEIDLAPHWSASLSLYWSGLDYFRHNLKFRTFTVMPEARYWLQPVNDGFFIGARLGLAYYNVAFGGDKRYQDHDGDTPALGGGVNVGFRFALPRNPRWKMEFSIGAGVYRLDYDIFANHRNGFIIGREKRTFFGIDNAAFSICYTFDVRKKGGDR